MIKSYEHLVDVLKSAPDEVIDYVMLACQQLAKEYTGNDGFLPTSEKFFLELQKATEAFFNEPPSQ